MMPVALNIYSTVCNDRNSLVGVPFLVVVAVVVVAVVAVVAVLFPPDETP